MPLPLPHYLDIKVVRARALQSLFTIVWSDVALSFLCTPGRQMPMPACGGGQQPV